jgi:hypothetical protein
MVADKRANEKQCGGHSLALGSEDEVTIALGSLGFDCEGSNYNRFCL